MLLGVIIIKTTNRFMLLEVIIIKYDKPLHIVRSDHHKIRQTVLFYDVVGSDHHKIRQTVLFYDVVRSDHHKIR